MTQLIGRKPVNKIAKIRVPGIKMIELDGIWDSMWNSEATGSWNVCIFEDEKAFIEYEKVIVIEGEAEVINPVINAIMEIIKT